MSRQLPANLEASISQRLLTLYAVANRETLRLSWPIGGPWSGTAGRNEKG